MKYRFRRRPSSEAHIGNVTIGGTWPIAIQSMTNTPTLDTDASAAQVIRIAEAGADIVRLTAQGVAHAKNLENIRAKVREYGIDVPLVADIHFNPAAAFEAALHVEKVRINPGNFVDPGRTFKQLEYTDEEYAAELTKIEDKLVPLLRLCREHSTALRIGVNHGSLSDRIMSRYGDTPAGMVESAMEFLRVCVKENFTDVVISIKASNVVVMTQTVRLLVEAMDAEDMHFPLHLGVTEAGDGEDGRVKSAVGIGSLLADGIGDTDAIKGTYLDNYRAMWDLYINNCTCAPTLLSAKTGDDSVAEFVTEQAVFYQNGTWAFGDVADVGEENLGMLPIYIGVGDEANQGLCTGTENYWCVNKNAKPEDIQATLDFMYWCVTSDEGTSSMASDMGFVIPFKGNLESSNLLVNIANDYVANGTTSVKWCFPTMPSEEWKNVLGSALTAYAADQTDANWETVRAAFVDNWAAEKSK